MGWDPLYLRREETPEQITVTIGEGASQGTGKHLQRAPGTAWPLQELQAFQGDWWVNQCWRLGRGPHAVGSQGFPLQGGIPGLALPSPSLHPKTWKASSGP